MDDREPIDAESLLDLGRDRAQNVERHLVEYLVFQRYHRLAGMPGSLGLLTGRRRSGRLAGLAQEQHERAVCGGRHRAAQLAEQLVGDRIRGYLESNVRVGAACNGRNERQLVAVGTALDRPRRTRDCARSGRWSRCGASAGDSLDDQCARRRRSSRYPGARTRARASPPAGGASRRDRTVMRI